MKKYKPIELARMFNLHPNSIRFYEEIGYISKAKRKANNYREFEEHHVLQLKICRYIFGYQFTNSLIRNTGNLVIKSAVSRDLTVGKQYSFDYIHVIQNEIKIAKETASTLHLWANLVPKVVNDIDKNYTRNDIANLLGTTKESVRNWERNDLIQSNKVGSKNERLFDDLDLERIRIVYMLRQTGYSISAIHRCLSAYDNGYKNLLLDKLNNPTQEELLSAGDCWLFELEKLENVAKKIPPIFEELKAIDY
ncbi:MerR family transcriptional regulator [Clostridioides difficile]|nr:MerR family transcriptional regulator [Clostridioides difficile]